MEKPKLKLCVYIYSMQFEYVLCKGQRLNADFSIMYIRENGKLFNEILVETRV